MNRSNVVERLIKSRSRHEDVSIHFMAGKMLARENKERAK